MECLETYLIPTITVDHPNYSLGQTVEVSRNSKYQKGLSGLDDPSGLSLTAAWEYDNDKMRDDSDILLRYIDKLEPDTDQGWFADIQTPRPINLSELPLDQIMDQS
ncbi:hypothetical protein V865_000278 [Kwoniella europaea PYCC6329]|uniref:Uncharacterized protein n=1 Tax=Kwoniella europaea PYCC6329 TaxID=1423913 RepID=A0AAX4K7B0_9TREE